MTKENWIQQIIQTADGIQQAEPTIHLSTRLQEKLLKVPVSLSTSFYIKWSVAAALVIAINIATISRTSTKTKHHESSSAASRYFSNSFSTSVTYTY